MNTADYTTAEHALHELRLHLDRISKTNKDCFGLSVEVTKGRHGQTVFRLTVVETQEAHTLAAEFAGTITEAANKLRADLPEYCKGWDYKFVE